MDLAKRANYFKNLFDIPLRSDINKSANCTKCFYTISKRGKNETLILRRKSQTES